jgi:2-keto-4-pentenoate hydratase
MLKLSLEELHEAIEYLYEALEILKSVLKEIENGSIRGMETSER